MGSVSTPYAPSVTYTAASGMDSLSLNNGALIETYNWNDRQQLTGITAGTLLTMRFYPCDGGNEQCASGNNGKIWRETITAGGSTAVQEYRYDTLNRLTLAAEKEATSGFTPTCPDAGSVWCYQFGYDTWGNRTIQQRTPASSSSWDAGSFHAKTNRIVDTSTDQTQWVYDAAGNLIQHGIQIFKYDAENAQVAQCTTSIASCVVQAGAGTLYVYDGEGNRVQRIGQDGTRTTYVYDALGNLAVEYGASVTATGTQYVTADHLGSTRLVTGSQTTRHDYEPYGAELNLSGTWRSGVSGYGTSSGIRPMFTGQERDSGTLDYFIARYYVPDQGRFMSVDPGNAGANPADPQSWNGYAYVNNNPLTYTDPTGEGIFGTIFGIVAGVFTANPWIGLAASAAGNGLDAAIWGPQAAGIPGTPFNLGSLTSCGGPLGTCGSLGAGPWSEITGLGNVRDPGRFIFTFEDQQKSTSGFWSIDYSGQPFWYEPTGGVNTGAVLKAAPKPSKLSVAGSCAVASLKDHLLGLGASAGASIATAPVPKPWLGVRDIGGPTNLLSKLGTYFNIRLSSPAAGGGANPQLGTLRAFGAAGRILGPAAWAITGGQVLKAGQDAYSCYSISH